MTRYLLAVIALLLPACKSNVPPAENVRLTAELSAVMDRLRDWPQLSRYQIENSTVLPPVAGENRVVFMGDSIFEQWKVVSPEFFRRRPYFNRGIGGQSTAQMLVRFRADVIALKPRRVIIIGGTNDIAGDAGSVSVRMIEDNLMSMAELAHANGIDVVLASLLPVSDYLTLQSDRRPSQKIVSLNAWMKRYAFQHGYRYLDYYALLADAKGVFQRSLSDDGVHPNRAGYDAITPLTEEAVSATVTVSQPVNKPNPLSHRSGRRFGT